MAYNIVKGRVQFSDSTTGSIESMVDTHSNQTVAGIKTFSQTITASTGISSSAYYGDGSGLSGLDVAVTTYANPKTGSIVLSTGTAQISGAVGLDFNSNVLAITGGISASVNISASSFHGSAAGLTSVPTNQFAGSISAADLSLGESTENSSGNLIVKLSSSSGLQSTGDGLRINPSLATAKTPPADADTFIISDSADSNVPKKLTYQNLAAAVTSGLSTLATNGNDGAVQIKNGSALQGPAELSFNTTTNTLTVTGQITASVHVSSSQIYAGELYGNGTGINQVQKIGFSALTASYTVTNEHNIMGINTSGSSAITASLQSASTYEQGAGLVFKDTAGSASVNNIVIQPSGSQKIDGNSLVKIKANYGAVSIASDGANNFYIVSTS